MKNDKLESAAMKAVVALNDWLRIHVAEDGFKKEHVEESYKRISEKGGTIVYASEIIVDISEALGLEFAVIENAIKTNDWTEAFAKKKKPRIKKEKK